MVKRKSVKPGVLSKLQQVAKSPRITVVGFLLLAVIVAVLLNWRFPNAIAHPNFYGEDGSVLLQHILDRGWLRAVFIPFNGYAIFGLYVVEGAGILINSLLHGSSIVELPALFAGASIAFMALVMSLPFLLFSDLFGRKLIAAVVLFSALMPLPMSPHVVIGNIGNLKWIFLYFAFQLVIYRLIYVNRLRWPQLVIIDSLLLLAAYTNSAVYGLMPLLIVPYVQQYWQSRQHTSLLSYIKSQLKSPATISMLCLWVLLLPQVIYVAVNGIPKLPGYLDTPYSFRASIEIFIHRTYLYAVTAFVNSHMNDIMAVLLFAGLLLSGWKLLRGYSRLVFFSGIYAAGVASLLFVMNRPGVSDFFFHYSPAGSGPDQFFYVQTLLMYLPLALVLNAGWRRIPFTHVRTAIVGLFVLLLPLVAIGCTNRYDQLWRNASAFENDAGTFTDQALLSCAKNPEDEVRVTVYPYSSGQFSLEAPTNRVCNDQLQQYQREAYDLRLRPNNNDYATVEKSDQFSQTFIATEPQLYGIRLFLSNFGKSERNGDYKLLLQDKACKSTIRSPVIPKELHDSSYYNIRFDPLADSKGKHYCFRLQVPSGDFDPIAIQRSKENIYPAGQFTENRIQSVKDVVFYPLYRPEK